MRHVILILAATLGLLFAGALVTILLGLLVVAY